MRNVAPSERVEVDHPRGGFVGDAGGSQVVADHLGSPVRAYAPGFSGIWPSTFKRQSFFQPATRRRVAILLPLLVFSALSRHNASLRSHARFIALFPAQCRWSSSRKQTSRTQCSEFSIPQ